MLKRKPCSVPVLQSASECLDLCNWKTWDWITWTITIVISKITFAMKWLCIGWDMPEVKKQKILQTFIGVLASLRLRSMAMLEVPDVLRSQWTQKLRKEFGRQADADSHEIIHHCQIWSLNKREATKYIFRQRCLGYPARAYRSSQNRAEFFLINCKSLNFPLLIRKPHTPYL